MSTLNQQNAYSNYGDTFTVSGSYTGVWAGDPMAHPASGMKTWAGDTSCIPWQRPQPAAVGWICPKCGAGMAPWASRCGCRGHYGFQWWSQWDTTHTVSSTIETTNDICTDMLWAAADSFRGVWDNDADAVYDDMGND